MLLMTALHELTVSVCQDSVFSTQVYTAVRGYLQEGEIWAGMDDAAYLDQAFHICDLSVHSEVCPWDQVVPKHQSICCENLL